MSFKKMTVWLSLTLATLLLFTACGGEDTQTPVGSDSQSAALSETEETSAEESESESETERAPEQEGVLYDPSTGLYTYALGVHAKRITVHGRSSTFPTGVTCDWSASGIEFSATYSSTLQIEAISNAEVAFRVFINEAETGIMTFSSGRSTAEVPGCKQYAEETVTVRLVRITNVESGNYGNMTVLSSLIMDGELLPMMSRGSFIEFVGDSITCGSGLGVPSGFDGSCTYAYLAATELNADYSMISVSGIGVSASTSRHNGRTIGSLYGLTNWYRSQTERYTPTRKADVVVVNLNTNDDSRGATKEQYQKDAKALIAAIRETHGENVPIVWVVGQMIDANSPVNGWLAEVYAELGGEAAGLYTVTTYKNTSGGASHPNATSHRDTAAALCDLIDQKELLG